VNTDGIEDLTATLDRAVVVLRGMAYEHRLHILILLRSGEQTPAELAEAISADATAVAHHLRFLKDARLVSRQRRGRNVFYALRGDATRRLLGEVLRYAEDSV
jgi:DNA-binding transcriptional ArsR family regulator